MNATNQVCNACCLAPKYAVFHGNLVIWDVTIVSFLLLSIFVLLFNLHRLYKNMVHIDFSITHRQMLIQKVESQESQEEKFIIPFYYGMSIIFMVVWLLLQLLVFVPNTNRIVETVKFVLAAGSAVLDNFMAFSMCSYLSAKQQRIYAFIMAMVISIVYLLLLLIAGNSECSWCTPHFASSILGIPYILNSSMFLILAILSKFQIKNANFLSKIITVRPAAFLWCIFEATAYGCSGSGLILLSYSISNFGYCLLDISVMIYTSLYAFVFYKTCLYDSVWCVTNSRVPDLRKTDFQHTKLSQKNSDYIPYEYRSLLQDPTLKLIKFQDLNFTKKVGAGGYGEVYLARWKSTTVAFKRLLYFNQKNQSSIVADFLHEIKVLSTLRHPNIVLFLGACLESGNQGFITEYISGGSLFDLLHEESENLKFLTNEKKMIIIKGILKGMIYLHSFDPPIIHRDLKSQNVLITDQFEAKICDFGLARSTNNDVTMTNQVGTPQYCAPEVILEKVHQHYDEKIDIWSFGIVCNCCFLLQSSNFLKKKGWEILSGTLPYLDKPPVKILTEIATDKLELPKFKEDTNPEFKEIILECWNLDPAGRPSFEELFNRLEDINL